LISDRPTPSGTPGYVQEKQKEEIRHLKLIVDRLSTKLGEYQSRFQKPEADFEAQIVDSIIRDPEHKDEGTKLD
jgi:hypothetical protein